MNRREVGPVIFIKWSSTKLSASQSSLREQHYSFVYPMIPNILSSSACNLAILSSCKQNLARPVTHQTALLLQKESIDTDVPSLMVALLKLGLRSSALSYAIKIAKIRLVSHVQATAEGTQGVSSPNLERLGPQTFLAPCIRMQQHCRQRQSKQVVSLSAKQLVLHRATKGRGEICYL